MKKRSFVKKMVATLSIAAMLASFMGEKTADAAISSNINIEKKSYADTIAEAEATKQAYEEKAQEAKNLIDQISTEYNSILAYIQELDQKQAGLNDQIISVTQTLDYLNQEKAETEAELAEATERMNEQYKTMSARIKYVYENGETTYWDIFLNAKSISDILNRVEYVNKIAEYDDQLLKDYAATVKEVNEYNDKLAIQLETCEQVQETLDYFFEYAQELSDAKNKALEEKSAQLGVEQEIYQEYLVEIETQQMTIDQAKAAKAEEDRKAALAAQQAATPNLNINSTGASSVAGVTLSDNSSLSQTIWPLPGWSGISSYFGYRTSPTSGASSNHKGIDIWCSYGTPIVAAAAGTVVASTWGSSQGNYVMINHGGENYTIYMHCSSLAVSAGTYVQQGQVIAYAGSTGVSTGVHLHFGVIQDGVYMNPLNYVRY